MSLFVFSIEEKKKNEATVLLNLPFLQGLNGITELHCYVINLFQKKVFHQSVCISSELLRTLAVSDILF